MRYASSDNGVHLYARNLRALAPECWRAHAKLLWSQLRSDFLPLALLPILDAEQSFQVCQYCYYSSYGPQQKLCTSNFKALCAQFTKAPMCSTLGENLESVSDRYDSCLGEQRTIALSVLRLTIMIYHLHAFPTRLHAQSFSARWSLMRQNWQGSWVRWSQPRERPPLTLPSFHLSTILAPFHTRDFHYEE